MIAGVIIFDDVGDFVEVLCIGNVIGRFIDYRCVPWTDVGIAWVACIIWTNIGVTWILIVIVWIDICDICDICGLNLSLIIIFYDDRCFRWSEIGEFIGGWNINIEVLIV